MENPPQSIMSKAELRQLKVQENNRRYREKYKDTISEKRKETTQCECGMVVNTRHLSEHKRNSKHSKKLILYKVECFEI